MPWYYQIGEGEIAGPVDLEALHHLVEQGTVTGNTQVSFAESGQTPEAWQLAHSINSLNLSRVGSPRPPQKVTQPPPQRLPADDPRVQTRRPQRKPVARHRMSAGTIVAIVLGWFLAGAGVLGIGLLVLTSYQFGGLQILTAFAPYLPLGGLLIIGIAILYEILRVNRATLTLLEREHGETQQPAPRPAPANDTPKPHPLD